MMIKTYTTELKQFRQQLYQNFNNRADTLMELVDAICSNPYARSVVEYSLTPCFRRSYSTVFKAINEMEMDELAIAHLLAPHLPRPRQRFVHALAVGVAGNERFAVVPLLDDDTLNNVSLLFCY